MKANAEPRCGVTASCGVFFYEIRCNGMTIFMEFMSDITFVHFQQVFINLNAFCHKSWRGDSHRVSDMSDGKPKIPLRKERPVTEDEQNVSRTCQEILRDPQSV